jgi:release factor glutamine methyltransferase
VVDIIEYGNGLGRQGTPQGVARRAIRKVIHFFCYNFVLKRGGTRTAHAAGFHLLVRPTVFHPTLFLTSEFFAGFIGSLDLAGKRVVDVGTGTGILALAAARAGAARVLAVDINPNAALTASENARVNGLGDRITAVCSNLLSAIAPRPLFDVIISSPPSFPGKPRDLADRAWHAGANYSDVAALFDQARERLAPRGRLYLLLSSDSDLDYLGTLIEKARFQARQVDERSIFIESLIIYELQAADVRVRQRQEQVA